METELLCEDFIFTGIRRLRTTPPNISDGAHGGAPLTRLIDAACTRYQYTVVHGALEDLLARNGIALTAVVDYYNGGGELKVAGKRYLLPVLPKGAPLKDSEWVIDSHGCRPLCAKKSHPYTVLREMRLYVCADGLPRIVKELPSLYQEHTDAQDIVESVRSTK